MKKNRSGISGFRKILNILIILGSIGAWLVMVFAKGGMLTDTGFRSLKYFTVLSNLFEGTASVIWLIAAARTDDGAEKRLIKAEKIKYVAAVSVALTFMTVMIFLGPLYGYPEMLAGVNFFLHLAVPVAALAECIFMSTTIYTHHDNRLAVVPMLVYGAVYLANNLINGTGEWPDTNDWYGFLNWGLPVGLVIFAGLCTITWLTGALLRRINNYYDRETYRRGGTEQN
jgi:predicted membrane protein